MALSETFSETSICNMALGRLGSKRGTTGEMSDVETDTTVQGIYCRQHYEQTRNALLRSHLWQFATKRAVLAEPQSAVEFEYNYLFNLPSDYLRLRSIYEYSARFQYYKYAIEGFKLYSDESSINIRYIAKITDVDKFDPLFTEIFILRLARKLAMPLTQDPRLLESLDTELVPLMKSVRAMDRNEQNLIGRNEMNCWIESRHGNLKIDSQLGSG